MPPEKCLRSFTSAAVACVLCFIISIPGHSASAKVGPRALIVVAHPDDESEMAGTIYHLAEELSGRVDQIIITDGEAGFRYSSLAERYYGVKLTDEAEGRRELPRIRREEAHHSAKVLGIEHQWFLHEKDDHFTLDAVEVLKTCWNRHHVLNAIREHLRQRNYDYIFILLPDADTHGAHKAASILTLEAVSELPADHRPIVLGAKASNISDEVFS